MNKSEIELELKAIEKMLEFGGPYFDKEESNKLVEAIAAYIRRRISTDRGWNKVSYQVDIDNGYPKIKITQSSNKKGEVYI